jgi:hypothetical protein
VLANIRLRCKSLSLTNTSSVYKNCHIPRKCTVIKDLNDVVYWIIYIGEVCKQNCQRQQHETVLALATLGDETQIGSFLLAKVSK